MWPASPGGSPAGTLLGNGSNDLLQLLFMSVLERGKTVVISQPTFTLYKLLARGLGADVREVMMDRSFRFDIDGDHRCSAGDPRCDGRALLAEQSHGDLSE